MVPSSAQVADPPMEAPALRGAVRPLRFSLAFIVVGVGTAVLTGVPTDLIANPWFTRMTPPQVYAYPVWLAAAGLSGLLAAVQWGIRTPSCRADRAGALGTAGTAAAWLAVGCPICNKLVVLALGVSGAVGYFAPVQPWLAAFSLVMLAVAIGARMRRVTGVGLPTPSPGPATTN